MDRRARNKKELLRKRRLLKFGLSKTFNERTPLEAINLLKKFTENFPAGLGYLVQLDLFSFSSLFSSLLYLSLTEAIIGL